MFFVAMFGVQDKDKHIGTYSNIACPSCGGLAECEVYKSYRYLHIFFIPVFRWNVRYIIKFFCCGGLYELDPSVGKQLEKNPNIEIMEENLRRINYHLPFKYCSNCKTEVFAEFNYCPYCGERL